MDPKPADAQFMKKALSQALKGLGRTSPNPAVGAVLVKQEKIIAKGYHRKAGMPHAEIEALNQVGGRAEGATLYVTMEPCNHMGRTPPCTEAILRSGVSRVVVGMKDPNPDVRGGGCEYLRCRGVQVELGILEGECRRLNEAFIKFCTTKRPFVILKSALTLDGWSATATGHSRWITGEKARAFVHRLRDRVDAVMVGVGTILGDDPSLTTRLGRGKGRDPLRIIVDTRLRTPLKARILRQPSSAPTILVIGPEVRPDDREKYESDRVKTVVCPVKEGRIDLEALGVILGKMSITSILAEGGARMAGSLIRQRLVDKFFIFKAPKLLGGDDGLPMAAGQGAPTMDHCLHLDDVQVRLFGGDILVIGYPDYSRISPRP